MPTTVVRPSSVLITPPGTTWSPTGGTREAVLADENDSTYVDLGGTPANGSRLVRFGMSAASLPDGAAIVSLVPKIRGARSSLVPPGSANNQLTSVVYGMTPGGSTPLISGSGVTSLQLVFPNAPGGGAYGPTADAVLPSAGSYNSDFPLPRDVANSIWLDFDLVPLQIYADNRIFRTEVAVNYVRAPTASAAAVSGVTTTTKPTISWTTTAPDTAQDAIQAVVWATADLANFPGGAAGMEAVPNYLFGSPTIDPGQTSVSGVDVGRDAQGPYFTTGGGTTYRAKAWSVDSGTGLPGWKSQSGASWVPDQDLPLTGAMKAYVRLGGTYANARQYARNSTGVASVSFTMAITPPPAPTSVTAVWQWPGAAGANASPEYRTKISVVLPTDTATRHLRIERQVAGSGRWALLPVGGYTPNLSTGAQTITAYDTAASPGQSMQYRASTGKTTANAWGTPVLAAAVAATVDRFILRNPLQSTGASQIRLQGDLETSADEIMGRTRGLGSAFPVATSDAISGESWQMEVITSSEAEFQALVALRTQRTTLLLQGDMTGWYRWVRFGESWSETILRQTRRRVAEARTRRVRFDLFETWPIPGQPLRADWG